jgi:hypothetical protein
VAVPLFAVRVVLKLETARILILQHAMNLKAYTKVTGYLVLILRASQKALVV